MGSPAASVYLDDLIYNSRLENRVSFEKSVLEELILLRSIVISNVSKADVTDAEEHPELFEFNLIEYK